MRFLIILLAVGMTACQQSGFQLPQSAEEFSQPEAYNNKVDVVILSDNSSSMLEPQKDLAKTIPSMVAALDRLGMDYHIAVATTDVRSGGNGGKLIGSPVFLKKGDANLLSELQSRVVAGDNGSDLEQGLESIYNALSADSLAQNAPGFLRADGLLSLVFLSNEDDYSLHVTTSGFVKFMDKLKPPFPSGAKAWVANYIGLTSLKEDCTTRQGFKEIGLKYLEVVNYSGGTIDSICQKDLSHAADNVRVRISEILTEYHLSRIPDLNSVRVTINGVVIPLNEIDGWSYVKDTNVIRFHGNAIPAVRDVVHVDFMPAEAN